MLWGRARSALFIDFDNVGSNEMRDRAAAMVAWLEAGEFKKGERARRFLVKRVYWNGKTDEHRAGFERAGFDAFACRPIATNKVAANKSASDLRLAVDVIDVHHRWRSIREVFLFSTDTDFVPVVDMLVERGVRVVTLGNEKDSSSAIYRDHADDVIPLRQLYDAFRYQPPQPRRFGGDPIEAPAPEFAGDVLELAAQLIVELAQRTPGLPIGRRTITRTLQKLPGFSSAGRTPWLGLGSYDRLLAEILRRRPTALKLKAEVNGGVSIYYAD